MQKRYAALPHQALTMPGGATKIKPQVGIKSKHNVPSRKCTVYDPACVSIYESRLSSIDAFYVGSFQQFSTLVIIQKRTELAALDFQGTTMRVVSVLHSLESSGLSKVGRSGWTWWHSFAYISQKLVSVSALSNTCSMRPSRVFCWVMPTSRIWEAEMESHAHRITET